MDIQDNSIADTPARPSKAPHALLRLAAAVQVQALPDAKKRTDDGAEARTWLLEPNENFEFWCHVLGYRADEARRKLLSGDSQLGNEPRK